MKFSIVIPTFNRSHLISRTISSALDQNYGNFEVIVVDDGSTDNTREVVSTFKDSRLKYYYKKNEERAVARNFGTKIATGDYINFLDSDDYLYKNHLKTAKEVVLQHDFPEFVHLAFDVIGENGARFSRTDSVLSAENKRLLKGNCFSCNGVFLKRQTAENYPFNTDRKLSGTEDYELWLRLACRYPLFCSNEVTSAIVHHDNRSVLITDKDKLINRIELLEKYLFEDERFLEEFKDDIKTFQSNNRIYIALHLALTKQHRVQSLNYLLDSLRISRNSLRSRAFYGTIKRILI